MYKRFWLGRHLMLKGKYIEQILNGTKRATIRPGRVAIKSKEFYIHAGGRIVAKAVVEKIFYKRVKELTDGDAKLDGFNTREELLRELKKYYPFLKENDYVTIIKFRIVEKLNKPEAKSYAGKNAVEIAKLALENLKLSEEERRVLEKLVETKSIRATAKAIYGSLLHRKLVRKILWKVVDKLKQKGVL